MAVSFAADATERPARSDSWLGESGGNGLDHTDLWLRAMAREGVSSQRMAGILGMSPSAFAQAFSVRYGEKNPVMKRLALGAPGRDEDDEDVLRAVTVGYATLLAERLGLGVGSEYVVLCRQFAEASLALMKVGR